MSSGSSSLDSLLSAPQLELEQHLRSLTPTQMVALLEQLPLWRPQEGPQTAAYQSQADILGYGGQAGGGKTDLALGLAGTAHWRSIIFRREYTRLKAVIERSRAIFGSAADFNASDHVWRFHDGRTVELGSMPHLGDEQSQQGQPHDLYVFDELTEFLEQQFRFAIGWLRSTKPGQRCRVVCPFNPPVDSDGEWVIGFFGPWLNENHPHPALPGELRWYTTEEGKDIEVPAGWRGRDADGNEIVPLSRTFIPAKLADNKHQPAAYRAVLQALPEPLRSKLLFGDFKAGREDNAYQVIPSEWVRLAQERWKARPAPTTPLDALGVDVARGGKDRTILTPRRGNWFAEQQCHPGKSTPDGQEVAELTVAALGGSATARANIDVIGVGSGPYDNLRNGWVDEDGDQRAGIGERAVAMNASEGSEAHDKSGTLGFVNQRAEWWWGLREALDPTSGQDLALPPDPELKADLCAPRWKPTARGIQIESKDDIKKRIGRSPDKGDSLVMAHAIKVMPGMGLFELMREQAAAHAAKRAKAAEPVQRRP